MEQQWPRVIKDVNKNTMHGHSTLTVYSHFRNHVCSVCVCVCMRAIEDFDAE